MNNQYEFGMKFSFEEASKILDRYKNSIIAIKGVSGIGLGNSKDYGGVDGPCFVVYIGLKTNKKLIPTEIEDIRVYLIHTDSFEAQHE